MKGATRANATRSEAEAISIHAPMKGATKMSLAEKAAFLISIHAPMKGATCSTKLVIDIAITFQFTLP